MKKILLTLSALAVVSYANAATSVATLQLNGQLMSTCTANLTSSTLTFQFTPGQAAAPQGTELQYACAAGTTLQSLAAQSTQGWEFNGTTSGSKIGYSLTNTGVNAPYASVAANLATTWSSAAGSLTANPVLTAPVTIDNAADPLLIGLQVAPAITPANAAVDTYSDTVTFTATY